MSNQQQKAAMNKTKITSKAFIDSVNDNGLTFKEWFRLADSAVCAVCGLGLDDLPDGNSWYAWDDNESPVNYARMILEEEGFDE
jgi:hypothetical protein